MGVIKSPEAPKAMATKKGVAGNDSCSASDMEMGNIIETAAGFVTNAVKKIVTKNNALNTPTGPIDSPTLINAVATNAAVPDFSSATPIAREHTSTINKLKSSWRLISSRFNIPKKIKAVNTTNDAVNNGIKPNIPASNIRKLPTPTQYFQTGLLYSTFFGTDK